MHRLTIAIVYFAVVAGTILTNVVKFHIDFMIGLMKDPLEEVCALRFKVAFAYAEGGV